MLTCAPKPAAIFAALNPNIPPPKTVTTAGSTPGTPLNYFPLPPILPSKHLAPF